MILRVFLLILMVRNVVATMAGEIYGLSLCIFNSDNIFDLIFWCILAVIYIVILKYSIIFIYHTMVSYNNMSVICLAIVSMCLLKQIDITIIISAGLLLLDNIIKNKKNEFNINNKG